MESSSSLLNSRSNCLSLSSRSKCTQSTPRTEVHDCQNNSSSRGDNSVRRSGLFLPYISSHKLDGRQVPLHFNLLLSRIRSSQSISLSGSLTLWIVIFISVHSNSFVDYTPYQYCIYLIYQVRLLVYCLYGLDVALQGFRQRFSLVLLRNARTEPEALACKAGVHCYTPQSYSPSHYVSYLPAHCYKNQSAVIIRILETGKCILSKTT